MAGGSLWAITSYFNPVGYRRRRENYRLFRERLAVPLATVELSFDGRFELGPGDAEALLQIHAGDVMWQKERLLNLALRLLPDTCDKIAWLDCDVVFTRDDWVTLATRALDEVFLLHLFQVRADLPRDRRLDALPAELPWRRPRWSTRWWSKGSRPRTSWCPTPSRSGLRRTAWPGRAVATCSIATASTTPAS